MLARSIHHRFPYITPLNHLQVDYLDTTQRYCLFASNDGSVPADVFFIFSPKNAGKSASGRAS